MLFQHYLNLLEMNLGQLRQVAELKDQIYSWKKIVNTLPDSIYVKDVQGQYVWINETAYQKLKNIHGIDFNIIGKSDMDVFPEETAKLYMANDRKVIEACQGASYQEVSLLPDGSQLIGLSFKEPLYDELGHVCGILGYSVDTHALNDVLLSVRDDSKAKAAFISNMSHDLRTPITGMMGLVQDMMNAAQHALSSARHGDAEQALNKIAMTVKQDSQLLMCAVNELLRVCNDTLDVARIESVPPCHQTELVNIRSLIKRTIALFHPVAQHKGIQLFYSIRSTVPAAINGVSLQLKQMLQHLLSNALKFTKTGSVSVFVESHSVNSTNDTDDTMTLEITVRDTGIGIPNNQFDKIFESFSRLSPSFEGVYDGLGMGLYWVKRYVESLCGDVVVESTVGQGSCFTVTIPATVPDQLTDLDVEDGVFDVSDEYQMQGAPMLDVSRDECPAVLIVEDNLPAAIAAKHVVESFNCNVSIAENGEQALSLAKNKSFVLILMDIGLPDLSGFGVAKAIRSLVDDRRSKVPIVALSGHMNDAYLDQELVDAGIQDIVTKPANRNMMEKIFNQFVFKAV